jgi:uncharacterized protein (DUF433 family)
VDVGAFTSEQAAALTGISEGQLERWAREGLFVPTHYAKGRPLARIYSFRDLVGLRTMARLRELGFSTQRLRELDAWLRREHSTPWAGLRLWIGPKKMLYFSDPSTGHPVGVAPPHQGGIAIALDAIADDVREAAKRYRVRAKDDEGKIARHRHVAGGRPVLEGTRIPVGLVQRCLEDGMSTSEILEEFPSLTASDIDAVLRAAPEPRRRTG